MGMERGYKSVNVHFNTTPVRVIQYNYQLILTTNQILAQPDGWVKIVQIATGSSKVVGKGY